jgi:tRNA G18 (ribose-2'-O)-methylase SpoU
MPIVPITDLDDPRLADYHHLRSPSRRVALERERGIFTVEGRLSIEALLASSFTVRSLFVAEEHVQRVASLVATEAPIYTMPARAMEAVSGVHFHRGVLAVAERPELPSVADLVAGARRLLVLEAVNDHENVGALFRNAAAFGVDAVVLDPTTSDPLYRRSTRVSLGHVLRVPFARVSDEGWPEALDDLRQAGLTTVALTPSAEAEPLGRLVAEAPARVALVLGAEGPGLTGAALAATDRRVRIPMEPGVDSVNVATAAAIALAALYGLGG